MNAKDKTTHFGFKDVPEDEKQKLVGNVFTSVASSYDIMNDVMSMGIHRLWKRHFTHTLGVRKGQRILDLAGGTGDIAKLMAGDLKGTGQIIVADINAAMLGHGRDRLTDLGLVSNLRYAQVNAEALPFESGSFDRVTIAFGLRNVTRKEKALAEMARVLKPGGKAAVLEFSQLRAPALRPLYDWYSFNALPRFGEWIASDGDSYQYLAESIRKHPVQEELADMMREAGFDHVDHRNLTGGMVAIHTGIVY